MKEKKQTQIDDLSPSIVRDFNKCIYVEDVFQYVKSTKIGAIDCINRGLSPAYQQ